MVGVLVRNGDYISALFGCSKSDTGAVRIHHHTAFFAFEFESAMTQVSNLHMLYLSPLTKQSYYTTKWRDMMRGSDAL